MSDAKQVKVDNWGIYFLQRLKHFFNRTDYCDLTLQFQDNAQLKVHRLVLSACTEYFELLERTCEMYEDCLVMPDDLQADVVVPIVNFMYTGQLEFKSDMLEKLYQTSLVMNMPVLSKLLEAHRPKGSKGMTAHHSYNTHKRSNKHDLVKQSHLHTPPPSRNSSTSNKRSYSKAFQNIPTPKEKPTIVMPATSPTSSFKSTVRSVSPPLINSVPRNKKSLGEPRPTRYEIPDELDTDNIFENSFCNISYTSKPLMVHPDSTKHYPSQKRNRFVDPSDPRKTIKRTPTMDIVECKRIQKNDNIFDDITETINDETAIYESNFLNIVDESPKDPNQLFDQILDTNGGPKVTIETKDSKQVNNIDHAKIISEVLKKYPHLVKSNKNIKLKILNKPSKIKKNPLASFNEHIKLKTETPEYTYETDVLDSKEAAKLIALGPENIKGPWICLICGTPGRALHFTSYYKFRRHLVDVHNEKPVSTICEYCGFRSFKRNYMLHHCYTKHGVEPPPQYNFPKCNVCDYVAITEGFLIKHKLSTHMDVKNFRCNVCTESYNTANQLLTHIQKTGHKYCAERKNDLQCIYCLKVFMREINLFSHLKMHHKRAARRDGIIEDSDEEKLNKVNEVIKAESQKYDMPITYDNENEDGNTQYQIGTHMISKKTQISSPPLKQKILNPGFSTPGSKLHKSKPVRNITNIHNEFLQDNDTLSPPNRVSEENIIIIDDTEYVMRDNQLIPRRLKPREREYVIQEIMESDNNQSIDTITPSTSMQYTTTNNTDDLQSAKMIIKKSGISQPIQIVVSNEEEYKALMSANHSIIFDDGDSNKTLSVMATPQNTTLDTTAIDLDNAQSNEMMIIPDDYPLSVSEGADNSNIVVVYSHQVGHDDDSNKQYQIISSQDIGAQYVQSSAIITQNFETVTTSTPVMSAHVIETQVDDSWQSNDQQNIVHQPVHITSEVQLQSIVAQQIKSETNSLRDLPEIQLIPATKEIPAQINEVNENYNQQNIINIENEIQHVEQVTDEEMQNMTEVSMVTNVPCETVAVLHKEMDAVNTINNSNHIDINVTQETHDIIPIIIQSEPDASSSIQNEEDCSDKIDESPEEINEPETETLIEQVSEEPVPMDIVETENSQENDIISQETSIDAQSNPEESVLTKTPNDQIRHLTSEWSEDEYEITTQEPTSTIIAEDITENIIVATSSASPEVEESIENIQQEMEKQMSDNPVIEETENSLEETPEEICISNVKELDPSGQEQQPAHITHEVVPAQEKISSLLNDWEDNDSQEEENSTNEIEPENVAEESAAPSNTDIIIPEKVGVITKLNSKKNDNIKSLVSDWDDDEEENK